MYEEILSLVIFLPLGDDQLFVGQVAHNGFDRTAQTRRQLAGAYDETPLETVRQRSGCGLARIRLDLSVFANGLR